VQRACAQVLRQDLLPRLLRLLSERATVTPNIPPLLPRDAPSAWGGTLKEGDRLLMPQTKTAQALERQVRSLSPWATGLLPLGHWTEDPWLVVERANLEPVSPQDQMILCAQDTRLYVSKYRIARA